MNAPNKSKMMTLSGGPVFAEVLFICLFFVLLIVFCFVVCRTAPGHGPQSGK